MKRLPIERMNVDSRLNHNKCVIDLFITLQMLQIITHLKSMYWVDTPIHTHAIFLYAATHQMLRQ